MTDRGDLALVIDIGTSGLKVGLSTLDGRLHDSRHATLVTTTGSGGSATQDPAHWWDLIAGFARTLSENVDATRIVAVSVTGQYASIVPVDEAGDPVGPCIMWMDTRGGRSVRAAVGGKVAGFNPRAAATFIRHTGGAPSPSGADGTGSLLHLVHGEPDVTARARWLLEPVDYLTMRFTGVPSATHASMVGWWLTDNRHLDRLDYDPALLSLLGVSAERLAPLVPFASITGTVTAHASHVSGVPEGTPVLAGMPDLHAAALGSGTTELGGPGHLALSTTSWISAPMPAKKTDILHSIATIPGLDAASYLIANNHDVGARALEWMAGALGEGTPIDFPALTAEAATAPPGARSILFTPWLAGERSPVDNHRARGGFHNLSLDAARGDLLRAVLEGVAYNSRWLGEYVDKFAGRVLSPLRMVGGGAQSALWCQIHADVMGRPIEQVAAPIVAQLRGAGILAGRTLGVIDAHEIPQLVEIAQRFEPDAKAHEIYERIYPEFPKLMKAQSGMFKRLQRRESS